MKIQKEIVFLRRVTYYSGDELVLFTIRVCEQQIVRFWIRTWVALLGVQAASLAKHKDALGFFGAKVRVMSVVDGCTACVTEK